MILGLPVRDSAMTSQARQAVIDHLLMKEVFHCGPENLAQMNHSEVMLHWEIREAIRTEEERQAKVQQKRYNTKRTSR